MKFDVNVHYPRILKQSEYAVNRFHAFVDPADIAQVVTLKLLENEPDMEFPNAYIDRAVTNQVFMWLNRQKRTPEFQPLFIDEDGTEAEFLGDFPAYDAKILCNQLLASCTPEERYYFKRKADGLDWGEIAAEVGLTLPAVKTAVHRARAKMAKRANFKILKAVA